MTLPELFSVETIGSKHTANAVRRSVLTVVDRADKGPEVKVDVGV